MPLSDDERRRLREDLRKSHQRLKDAGLLPEQQDLPRAGGVILDDNRSLARRLDRLERWMERLEKSIAADE
jgi:hypothetical protein